QNKTVRHQSTTEHAVELAHAGVDARLRGLARRFALGLFRLVLVLIESDPSSAASKPDARGFAVRKSVERRFHAELLPQGRQTAGLRLGILLHAFLGEAVPAAAVRAAPQPFRTRKC